MKLRMLTRMAGPLGNWFPGQEVEVDEELASALITGHYAEPILPIEAETVAPPETPEHPKAKKR